MVLHEEVRDVALGVALMPLVERQREDFRERGVDETVVVRENAHPSECVDCHEVLGVVLDAVRRRGACHQGTTHEKKTRKSYLCSNCVLAVSFASSVPIAHSV